MGTTEYYGRGTWAGLGKESSYGTAVARATWCELIRATIRRRQTWAPRPHLVLGDGGATRSRVLISELVEGELEFELRYTGSGLWLEAAMGTVAEGGGGGPTYTHTFTRSNFGALPHYTLELVRGDGGNSEVFDGVVVQRLVIRSDARGYVRVTATVIGRTATARGAAGTPTAGDASLALAHHFGTLGWNSATWSMQNWELTIDNRLAERQRHGSLYTAKPHPTAPPEFTLRAAIDVDDAFYTAYLAGTESDLTLTGTSATWGTLAFTLHNAAVDDHGDPITGPTMLTSNVTWRGQADSSDQGIAIVSTNADATYDVN